MKRATADLGPLAPLVDAIAARVVEQLRPLLEGRGEDELVDRKSCGVSKRLWDRLVADGEIAVMRDGRRYVAKRGDVMKALDRRRVTREPVVEPRDEEEAELEAAGIRLVGGSR